MKRFAVGRPTRSTFSKYASKTRAINLRAHPMRGGIAL